MPYLHIRICRICTSLSAVSAHPYLLYLHIRICRIPPKVFGFFHSELGIALGECLNLVIRPSAAVEELVAARLGGNQLTLGVHIRVTMSKEAGKGGDTQIGPSSTIPLRRQGQVCARANPSAIGV
jgi:hypothetical protein